MSSGLLDEARASRTASQIRQENAITGRTCLTSLEGTEDALGELWIDLTCGVLACAVRAQMPEGGDFLFLPRERSVKRKSQPRKLVW